MITAAPRDGAPSRTEDGASAVPIAARRSQRSLALGALRTLARRPAALASLPDRAVALERVCLDERRIAPYARLCGFSPRQGVPLTWPFVAAFPLHMELMLSPAFGLRVPGLVHLRNRIALHAHLELGQALSLTARFGRLAAHDKGQAFTIETFAEHRGRRVWDATSTYLSRAVPNPSGAPLEPLERFPVPLRISGPWTLGPDLGRRYAKVAGDANPIHLSRIAARLSGLRRPIAHGMWTKARAVAATTPEAPLAAARIEVAFRTPIELPGRILLLSSGDDAATALEMRDRNAETLHMSGMLAFERA